MISELEAYYVSKEEPVRSTLLALRSFILGFDEEMSESWTHRMPMFRYKKKLFCYLWTDKKTYEPYLGIYKGIEIEHPELHLGNRNKMKVMYFDASKDIPKDTIDEIFTMAMKLY
ncbi:MAG: DUF1801 domain-containing protein [Saprospiraceae bacterium]|nr:DUF1801 domain-containing protein [Saprospiraceae bacterium]